MESVSYGESQVGRIKERLPNTFEKSDVLEVLAGIDTVVERASAATIKESLLGQKVLVRSADHLISNANNLERVTDGFNVTTTVDRPSVVFIHGASFCSLDLILDKKGNAVGIHRPMLPVDDGEDTVRDINNRIDTFLRGGIGVVDDDNVLLVSGTNVNLQDVHERVSMLDMIKDSTLRQKTYPRQKITTLFIKPEESHYENISPRQTYMRKLVSVLGAVLDFKRGTSRISNNTRDVEGLIFIPKQLDSQGKNRILLIDRDTNVGEVAKEIFDITPSQ